MKYICIHGHFYQPPRENAWLEYIQKQDSAAPFHDWNERINFECYAPNRAARLLDSEGKITDIINNYEYISFNFGPTLLSWMEKFDPLTYEFLQKADKKSAQRLDGHGNAMAQVYNHMIMPLANSKDKETQVIWGIKDFEFRFGRRPEGMWLAETAVDSETLELLADNGIAYVVLAPRQFKRYVRRKGESILYSDDPVDCTKSYTITLQKGKEITAFFYDGRLSQGIAFEGLLNDGRHLAEKLMNAGQASAEFGIINVATDGETYGHHHKYGEMALASCIHEIDRNENFELINYGWYAANYRPESEIEIVEYSSWSCVHGVERWRADCGCNTGGNPDWNQKWRAPLREALDWIRDSINPLYTESISKLVKKPHEARNHYIDVILDRKEPVISMFLEKWSLPGNIEQEKEIKTLRLFELQRNLMLMYTSCGWFFDEVSGIETNQILQYAARAIAYAKVLFGKDFEKEFLGRLQQISSNLSLYKNAGNSYMAKVVPGIVNLERVAMHVAAAAVFEESFRYLELFNYKVTPVRFEKIQLENRILAFGITEVKSKVTWVEERFAFFAGYFGQHFLHGFVNVNYDHNRFSELIKEIKPAFAELSPKEFDSLLKEKFGGHVFSIDQLFYDQRRKILNSIVQRNLQSIYKSMLQIYKSNYDLMTLALKEVLPLNSAFVAATYFVMNQNIKKELEKGMTLAVEKLIYYWEELLKWNLDIDERETITFIAGESLFQLLNSCVAEKEQKRKAGLEKVLHLYLWTRKAGLELNMWKIQNKLYRIAKSESKGSNYSRNEPLIAELLESFGMSKVRIT